MATQPNAGAMTRLVYLVGGLVLASWGLWGADHGVTEWTWLLLGGIAVVLGLIGYSPLHALFWKKDQKAS